MINPTKTMFASITKITRRGTGLLALAAALIAPLSAGAATNTYTFNDTVLAAGAGPVNPANGPLSFSGAGLAVGDRVVFDGIVINVPGAATDGWGSINLNQNGGIAGVTAATLGVLVRTSSANPCSLWTNGIGAPNFAPSTGVQSNRVRIELTVTEAGSTTNMDWVVQIDQGITGAFTTSQSGTGLNFASNTVSLTFGSRNFQHLFIQNQPAITVGTPTPATNTVAVGFAATFNVNFTGGFPRSTTQQWLSNGVPIAGATGLAYTTPATTASYNGAQYSVIVSNQLNPANVVTGAVAALVVRSVPGFVTFNFNDVFTPNSGVADANPPVAISGTTLLAGDAVVFDGIVLTNGALTGGGDGWAALNFAAGGFQGVTGAKLGALVRLGAGPSQLFINGGGAPNTTSGGAPVNRVRIEFYPATTGSTTNLGWSIAIDQNLSGTFQPAVTGTNLTFNNNTIPLSFGANAIASRITQNPQAVSVFTGPTPAAQVVGVGSPATVGVTVKGWNPAFQWRKNGVVIPDATNRSYTLPSATLGDNGAQFSVVVSNRLNSANVVTSGVATVSVQIPNNLTWYPALDFTTWDTATANWTTNGGTSQALFSSGNNVTFDALGYNLGGNFVTVTNSINANAVTVSATAGQQFVLAGAGSLSAQSLLLTGDGTGALGLQTAASFTSATIDAGSTLQVGYSGINGSIQANNLTNNGTIDFQNVSGTLIIPGRLAGAGTIIQNGAGTTILTATNSSYTVSAVNGGALVVASAPNPGVIFNNAEFRPDSAVDLTIGNSFTGPGHFYFTGFQKTKLTGVSDHTGINQIFWSQVTVDNPAALGDPNFGLSISSGADRFGGLYLSNNIAWIQSLVLEPRLGPPSAAATAPHVANASGTNSIDGPLSFNTGQGGSQLNVEAAAGLLTINSVLLNNAANTNTLNLQGAATGIWNGDLVEIGSPQVLNVLKRGTGKWTLNGNNTYSGTTTVSNGTLVVNGQLLGAGAVSVQSGAFLAGAGIISGPVTVAAGGTIAPGASIGTLTINNSLTLSAGSVTSVEINKTAATRDQIGGVGVLTYGGTLAVANLSGTLTTNDSFQLFSATSYAGAFSAVSPPSPGAGLAWNTNTLTSDGTLRITAGSTVNTTPTNITSTVVGGNTLQLNWPVDRIGWTLEVQTNSVSVGLATNWVRIPSSATTNQVSVPIVPSNGSVFYRLVYP
jgi:autotransporter-associated beta strand protein